MKREQSLLVIGSTKGSSRYQVVSLFAQQRWDKTNSSPFMCHSSRYLIEVPLDSKGRIWVGGVVYE